MYNHILFLTYWVVNLFFLYLFGVIAPDALSLGNGRFNLFEASFYTAFWTYHTN
jgi:hypothetical protein